MMSDRVLGSDHSDGTCKKSENSCESSWLARWTHLGSASMPQDKTRFSVKPADDSDCNKMILSGGSEIAARDSSLAKRARKAGNLEDGMNESPPKIKPSPMFNIFQQKVSVPNLKNDRTSVCSQPTTAATGIFDVSDSLKEISGKPMRRFQATDHLPTVEETDVNVSMKLKGKSYCDFLNLFPDLYSRRLQETKLHPEYDGGLTEDEEQQRSNRVKNLTVCIKNESSAETDIFDVDNFQKNRLSGITPSASNKAVKRKQKSLAYEIPDMNQEPPVVPDYGESSKHSDKQTSSSKTQSLNMEHFVSNTGESFSEPGYRWVKRLKTSASNSTGHASKSLSTEKDLPSEKVNDFLTRIMKCRNPSAEERNLKPLVKNSKDQDITLLHPWIQRWCQSKQSRSSTETEVIREPGSSKGKMLDDEFQKKQFPSIAAMALMGKALNGFSPSELRKRGSLHVWRTRDIM